MEDISKFTAETINIAARIQKTDNKGSDYSHLKASTSFDANIYGDIEQMYNEILNERDALLEISRQARLSFSAGVSPTHSRSDLVPDTSEGLADFPAAVNNQPITSAAAHGSRRLSVVVENEGEKNEQFGF